MFLKRRKGTLNILQTDLFPSHLRHAFATRRVSPGPGVSSGDQANFRIDSLPETSKWWTMLRDSIFTPDHVCFVHTQVHGGDVRLLDTENPGGEEKEAHGFRYRILGEGDGIIKPFTRKPIFLTINTADCLPCLVYDTESGAVGVIHAGWRGLAADIPAAAVRAFKQAFGTSSKNLFWAIGPSIDVDNYEVGPEVIAALETAGYAEIDWKYDSDIIPGWMHARNDRFRVNLAACLALRLRNLGIPDEQIDFCSLSTFGNPATFYSFRRDGDVQGLQASVIG